MCIVSFFFLSKRLPQISTRNDTPCPYTTLFRTSLARPGGGVAARPRLAARGGGGAQRADARRDGAGSARARRSELARDKVRGTLAGAETGARPPLSRRRHGGPGDRKRVGEGKRVVGRGNSGGCRTMKNKQTTKIKDQKKY